MMRFAIVSLAASAAAYVPLDIPRELLSDVNKGSQSVINLIPESSFLQQRGGSVLSGLDSTIKAVHPAEPISLIHQTLSDALFAAAVAEGVEPADVTCIRDFSGCPAGWNPIDGGCAPTSGYSGPCSSIDVSGLTPVELSSVAGECGVSFPCM